MTRSRRLFEIDVATSANTNIRNQVLKEKLLQKWKVAGSLGTVTLKLEEWLHEVSGTTSEGGLCPEITVLGTRTNVMEVRGE